MTKSPNSFHFIKEVQGAIVKNRIKVFIEELYFGTGLVRSGAIVHT